MQRARQCTGIQRWGERERDWKGRGQENSSEIFVVGHSFKSLIKENNFAVWRNEEGGGGEAEMAERLFF